MNTFLPVYDYGECAAILDDRRLNKQRQEGVQILNALGKMREEKRGWVSHTAVCMWRGYESQLCLYIIEVCRECDRRGIADNVGAQQAIISRHRKLPSTHPPWWLGVRALHVGYRMNLLFKDPEFYGKRFDFSARTFDKKPAYVWPVHADEWSMSRMTEGICCVRGRKIKPTSVEESNGMVVIGDRVFGMDRKYLLEDKCRSNKR